MVHQTIEFNPLEERDMAAMEGLRRLGIGKGKPFDPTPAQQATLEEAALVGETCWRDLLARLVGETWAMGNTYLKRDPVKHWADDPKSQWQYILFMQSPLDQMAARHMETDARAAYTYEAITVTEASTQNLVDAGVDGER